MDDDHPGLLIGSRDAPSDLDMKDLGKMPRPGLSLAQIAYAGDEHLLTTTSERRRYNLV